MTAGPVVLHVRRFGTENGEFALVHGICAAGDSGHLRVGQRPVPDRDMVNQPGEAGCQLSVFVGGSNQERQGAWARLADRVFLVDQHAVDEELQFRAGEAENQVVPVTRTDQADREISAHDGVADIVEQRIGADVFGVVLEYAL